MHGIVFAELKKYVDANLGPGAWPELTADAGIATKVYLPIAEYPDADMMGIVAAAARKTGVAEYTILQNFGEFIAPALLKMYRSLVKPEWRTLELIENVEQTIHKVVRIKNPGAHPPELKTSRPSADEVVIHYTSPRRLCSVAKGIATGMAKQYSERIAISESSCMLKGGRSCEISIRLVK